MAEPTISLKAPPAIDVSTPAGKAADLKHALRPNSHRCECPQQGGNEGRPLGSFVFRLSPAPAPACLLAPRTRVHRERLGASSPRALYAGRRPQRSSLF